MNFFCQLVLDNPLNPMSWQHVVGVGNSKKIRVNVSVQLQMDRLTRKRHLGPPFGDWLKLYPAIFGGS